MATLVLKNLTKRWGETIAVDSSNIDIKDQEFMVFLGPSGCGKTTTMRMIAGLEEPTSGEIIIDGKVVNDLEPKERDIAMVFQNYGLYPHLTVYENIRFPLKVRKIDPPGQDAAVRKAAEMVELGNLLDRRPKELSGGQRQRVALARAIVRKPKIFLMDEPLSNLDAKLRVSTRAQLKNLQRQLKTTTVYVTHDQIEAMTMADRVVIMNHGKIQQIGTPKEIYNNPANLFVAGFIGAPPMNIIKGEVRGGTFTSDHTVIPGLNGEGKVTVGFRAEDVIISKELLTDKNYKGEITTEVYNFELLGDATLVSVMIQDRMISAKADKNFQVSIGDTIHIYLDPEHCCLFDESGERILNR